jgi:two-component system sensor histidine kinase UhpB
VGPNATFFELTNARRDVQGQDRTLAHARQRTAEGGAAEDYGVLAALRWYGGQFAGRTGLKVTVQGEEPAPRLAPAKETALFRITQEALNNVAKHAHARQVMLYLHVVAERVWLTVTDDGAGFQPQSCLPVEGPAHWGLLSMREQAEAVGGSLEVESAPGQGTRLTVEVARSGGAAK